jgi:hypothetical protein
VDFAGGPNLARAIHVNSTLHLAHNEADPWEIIGTHGLDYSTTASSGRGEVAGAARPDVAGIGSADTGFPARLALTADLAASIARLLSRRRPVGR